MPLFLTPNNNFYLSSSLGSNLFFDIGIVQGNGQPQPAFTADNSVQNLIRKETLFALQSFV